MRQEDAYSSLHIHSSVLYVHKRLPHPLTYTYTFSLYMSLYMIVLTEVPVYYPTLALYLYTKTEKVIDVRIA